MSTVIQERRTFVVSTDTGKFAVIVHASRGHGEPRAQVQQIQIRGFDMLGEVKQEWTGPSPIVVVIRDSQTIQPLRDLRDAIDEAIQFCEGHGLV